MLTLSHFLDKETEARTVRSLAQGRQHRQDSHSSPLTPGPEPLATALRPGPGDAAVAQCISVERMKTCPFGLCRREISSGNVLFCSPPGPAVPIMTLHHCCFRKEILCGPGGREDSSEMTTPLSCLPPLQAGQGASWDSSFCHPLALRASQQTEQGGAEGVGSSAILRITGFWGSCLPRLSTG